MKAKLSLIMALWMAGAALTTGSVEVRAETAGEENTTSTNIVKNVVKNTDKKVSPNEAATADNSPALNNAVLSGVMQKYLAQQGDFCLGKFDWPIDVSAHDIEIHTNNALQMPALEKIGLVTSSDNTAIRKIDETDITVPVRRYVLTTAGQKFYLQKTMHSATSSGDEATHSGDFCAGKLSLDKIVGWDTPHNAGTYQETTVNYTYNIAAADWTHNANVRKVFPMLDRIVSGAGNLQLQQRVRLTPSGWTAVNLWE